MSSLAVVNVRFILRWLYCAFLGLISRSLVLETDSKAHEAVVGMVRDRAQSGGQGIVTFQCIVATELQMT